MIKIPVWEFLFFKEDNLNKNADVQKIAAKAEEISRFIYREGFLLIEKAKLEEIQKITEELEGVLEKIKKISVINID